jgi:hypothetical protein
MKPRRSPAEIIEDLFRKSYGLALNTGDVLVVRGLDRLARSTRDLQNTLDAAKRMTDEERKQFAAGVAADVYNRLSQPPNEEQEFEQRVWLALKLLLDEPLDEPADRSDPAAPTLQSEKLYRRWSVVHGLHESTGLSWERAYQCASGMCEDTPCAGTASTMKNAYVLVAGIRRAIRRRLEREGQQKASGSGLVHQNTS